MIYICGCDDITKSSSCGSSGKRGSSGSSSVGSLVLIIMAFTRAQIYKVLHNTSDLNVG